MRLILKVLALPLAGFLALIIGICSFLLVISGVILNIVSVLVVLVALLNIFAYDRTAGLIWLAIAFLISPFGLPKVAEWLISRMSDVYQAIKNFISE